MLIPKIAQSTTYIFVQRATLARSLRDSLEKKRSRMYICCELIEETERVQEVI